MTVAYPLHWPVGYPRTKVKVASRFQTTINGAVKNVQNELRLFGKDTERDVKDLVISSNVTLSETRPADPGVAIYFRWDGIDCCIAIDRYPKPEDNLQAIAKVIEAERSKIRHGGLNIVRASFRGYAALPPPKDPDGQLAPPWRTVLFGHSDIICTVADVERRYRELVKTEHPDRGGNPARFNIITEAVRQAREELKG